MVLLSLSRVSIYVVSTVRVSNTSNSETTLSAQSGTKIKTEHIYFSLTVTNTIQIKQRHNRNYLRRFATGKLRRAVREVIESSNHLMSA